LDNAGQGGEGRAREDRPDREDGKRRGGGEDRTGGRSDAVLCPAGYFVLEAST